MGFSWDIDGILSPLSDCIKRCHSLAIFGEHWRRSCILNADSCVGFENKLQRINLFTNYLLTGFSKNFLSWNSILSVMDKLYLMPQFFPYLIHFVHSAPEVPAINLLIGNKVLNLKFT